MWRLGLIVWGMGLSGACSGLGCSGYDVSSKAIVFLCMGGFILGPYVPTYSSKLRVSP